MNNLLKRKKHNKPILIPEGEEFQIDELIFIWVKTEQGAQLKKLRHVENREVITTVK